MRQTASAVSTKPNSGPSSRTASRWRNLRDIIASKRASNREKDLVDLLLLEEFRREYEKLHAPLIETAADKALRKGATTRTRHRH